MKKKSALLLLTAMLCSSPLLAEDERVQMPDEDAAAGVMESAPNLREELGGPDADTSVDVRSYQRKDGAKVTEYAVRGRVFKIKVEPAGGLPAYYLYDRDGDGTFEQRLPGGAKRISPPTWVLQEF